jgi:hypothetical protein
MSENFIKLKSSAIKLLCVLLIAYIIESYGIHFKELYETFGKIFYMLGGTYLTANLMSTPIQEFQKALNPYLPRVFRSNQKLEDCIFKYQRIKQHITKPDTIKKIDQYIQDAELYISTNLSKTYDTLMFDAIITKINFILTIHEPIPKIRVDINKVISKFDDMVVDNKDELISKILVPFILKLNGESNIPINPVYLLGSPGVGKTHFVKKMADVLNIPIINATILDYNYHRGSHHSDKFDDKMVHMYIRSLYTSITTKKSRTFIMFIDEFDKKLQRTSDILEYLNCHNNEVYDSYIDITADIGDILPVCAGNKRISNIHKCHIPLDDRFVTINFPKMSNEVKRSIVYDIMNVPKSSGIDTIIKNDKFHGIRQLLMKVNLYRAAIMGKDFFKGTNWEKTINAFLLKENGEEEEEDSEEDEDEEIPLSRSKNTHKARSKSPAKKRIKKIFSIA